MDERTDGQGSESGAEARRPADDPERARQELRRLRELDADRDRLVSELGHQIEVLQRQRDEIDRQHRETREAKEATEEEVASLRARLDALYASETWRAGKVALWLPKKFRQGLERRHGRGGSSA